MLLRALFAQARRTAASGTVVDTATEKLRACLSRRALSTGARAEKASASSSSMPVCDADDEDSSSSSSSDLDDFRAMLSDFASREIAPLAEEIDRKNTAPMDLWTKMGEFGLHGEGKEREAKREEEEREEEFFFIRARRGRKKSKKLNIFPPFF
jgi:hypothetical protein